ncbi:MAG: HAMP domain-containing histidine kinase [Acidobacteria bacterium]|nr:HAMP domain-containing histidine kinase [Acidobacteriota bacterium]
MTRLISSEMDERPREERDQILKRYSETYQVEFFIFDNNGKQLAGREITLPAQISAEITRPEPNFLPPHRQGNPAGERGMLPRTPPGGGPPSFYLRTTQPTQYWMVVRTFFHEQDSHEPVRARLLAASDSFSGHGLFFNPTPWLLTACIICIFTILFWLPFVRGMTRAVGQMTRATEQIADEKFDVRVSERRTDELGRLGKAVNHLASRLSGFVHGQKRFMGDISHELNSPLARMQFALSILEDRVAASDRRLVEDVKEEVELMTKLVRELLTYSEAGIRTAAIELEPVALRPLVESVIEREKAGEQAELKLKVDDDLKVLAQPELLSRALANVLRNAVRYAGESAAITIAAERVSNRVSLSVMDNGAGVPEAALEKLFDPFYRIESDRSRATGGTGLGLAIVKSCIEACNGTVAARNLKPHGFEVKFLLKSV